MNKIFNPARDLADRSADPHAEVEESAADAIQKGIMLVD